MLLKISKLLKGKEVVVYSNITKALARTIISQEFPSLSNLDLFTTGERCIISIDGVILHITKDNPVRPLESL